VGFVVTKVVLLVFDVEVEVVLLDDVTTFDDEVEEAARLDETTTLDELVEVDGTVAVAEEQEALPYAQIPALSTIMMW